MKYLLVVLISVLFVSCGDTKKYYVEEDNPKFEGSFYLENNSYIELAKSGDYVHIISSGQLLTTVNPNNNTYAELPKVSGKYRVVDGEIKFTKNLNFTSGNDVEEDDNGRDIRNQRRVDVRIYYNNGKLTLKYSIYSDRLNNNANEIVAVRELTQE